MTNIKSKTIFHCHRAINRQNVFNTEKNSISLTIPIVSEVLNEMTTSKIV